MDTWLIAFLTGIVASIVIGVVAGWIVRLSYFQTLLAVAAMFPAIGLGAVLSRTMDTVMGQYAANTIGLTIGFFVCAFLVGLAVGATFRWSWRVPSPPPSTRRGP